MGLIMKISRRSSFPFFYAAAGMIVSGPAMAFSLPKIGGSSGGGADLGSIKKLLAAAARADAQMTAYFLIALGRKDEADMFSAASQAMSEDTVDAEYDKLNKLKDEHPMKADDLGNFESNAETNAALAAGNAMGSVALMNYVFVLPQLAGAISAIKGDPMLLMKNTDLIATLANAVTAIPSGISTITEMVKVSSAISAKNNIPIKSKEEIAELSGSIGGTADTKGLPE